MAHIEYSRSVIMGMFDIPGVSVLKFAGGDYKRFGILGLSPKR